MSNITDIEKLNFYSWTNDGMDENPNGIPSEDVFVLRSDVIAALQNEVSDISADKFYKLFKDELLLKCDRLLRDKGMSGAESNECNFCISKAIDAVENQFKEYASILNEREDINDNDLKVLKQIRNYFSENDAVIFNQTAFTVINRIIKNIKSNSCNIYEDWRQKLFDYMRENHNITLLESDMADIKSCIIPRNFPEKI